MNFNQLSLKFNQDAYMKMLTDDFINDEELREAIINDFMKSIENYRRIREFELTKLLQKYSRKLYKKAMYRAGYDMFDYEGNRDEISTYIGKFTFDEYTDVAYFYLDALKKDLLGKKSKMLKKIHQEAREFLFMRVYRVVDNIMNGINCVSDFSNLFTVHYSIDKSTIGDIIMGYTIKITREISAMILYDRSMVHDQKAEKELYRVEKPEFIKPDVSGIMRYAECEDLKRLPYNIESFLFAATNAFNLVYNLVGRSTFNNEDFPTAMERKFYEDFPTATERKFYGAMANIQAEIRNRIQVNPDIEVVKRDSFKFQPLSNKDDQIEKLKDGDAEVKFSHTKYESRYINDMAASFMAQEGMDDLKSTSHIKDDQTES